MKKSIKPVFKNVSEYVEFAKENHVYGAEAITLKKKLDKLYIIPEPKIKR